MAISKNFHCRKLTWKTNFEDEINFLFLVKSFSRVFISSNFWRISASERKTYHQALKTKIKTQSQINREWIKLSTESTDNDYWKDQKNL